MRNAYNSLRLDFFKSTVLCHESKPRWQQQIKVLLPPMDSFDANTHLRFLLKHRSKDSFKDRDERPFAMAFLKITNGSVHKTPETTAQNVTGQKIALPDDDNCELLVYTLKNGCSIFAEGDGKRSPNENGNSNGDTPPIDYLKLPATRLQCERAFDMKPGATLSRGPLAQVANGLYTLCNRDILHVKSTLCSTQLTQDGEEAWEK